MQTGRTVALLVPNQTASGGLIVLHENLTCLPEQKGLAGLLSFRKEESVASRLPSRMKHDEE